MDFLSKMLFLFGILCVLTAQTDSRALTDINNQGDKYPTNISCYKDNGLTPMRGDVPDFFDCNRYYTCDSNQNGTQEAISRECQRGHDGALLFYNFEKCQCDYHELAVCYDNSLPDHQSKMFICAEEANDTN